MKTFRAYFQWKDQNPLLTKLKSLQFCSLSKKVTKSSKLLKKRTSKFIFRSSLTLLRSKQDTLLLPMCRQTIINLLTFWPRLQQSPMRWGIFLSFKFTSESSLRRTWKIWCRKFRSKIVSSKRRSFVSFNQMRTKKIKPIWPTSQWLRFVF